MHGFNGTVRMFPFHDCTALPCQLGNLYETICLIGICRLNLSAVHPHWTPTFLVPLVPVHQNNIFSDQRHTSLVWLTRNGLGSSLFRWSNLLTVEIARQNPNALLQSTGKCRAMVYLGSMRTKPGLVGHITH